MSKKKPEVYCTYQEVPEHRFPGHPESPQRLRVMRDWLEKLSYPEIQWLTYELAQESDVTLIHRHTLLEELKAECHEGTHQFEPSPSYVTGKSYNAALGAVGATLAVSRRIITEGVGRGFAIVRPPGHHAEPDASMGFCLMNNIAIAAADAVACGLGNVAIFDFDAHHGNGTEAAFWDTSEVGFCSTHENGIYPGTGHTQSASHARGRIIDIPLPAFAGNSAFTQIVHQVVEPWLAKRKSEMLFVSAGFDGHFSDPFTSLTLDTGGYYSMTSLLVQLAETYCEGRIMFVLEGGYDPIALKDNIQACLAAMSGYETYADHYGKGPDVNVNIEPFIEEIRTLHQL